MLCKGDGKVIFTRPFLLLDKVTLHKQINVLEMYWKGDISDSFTKCPSLQNVKVLFHSVNS